MISRIHKKLNRENLGYILYLNRITPLKHISPQSVLDCKINCFGDDHKIRLNVRLGRAVEECDSRLEIDTML
jgi:hypothetical protein